MKRWRPGLRTSIVLTVIAITVAATGAMAGLSYQLQQTEIRTRFTQAALADFSSDRQQIHQWLVNSRAVDESKLFSVGQYLDGRLALDWSIVNFNDALGPRSPLGPNGYEPVLGRQGPVDKDEVDKAM